MSGIDDTVGHARSAKAKLAALRWLPALTAVAYLATVADMGPRLVRALGWDSDVASPFALAERLRGHGPVYIPHNGSWTSLWWMLATRHLPGHVQLWQATGYAFALIGAALLGWATARVAGRWAGITAAATAVIVGPLALRSLLTVVFHVHTPFTAELLAAYLVALARVRSRTLAIAVGLLAGLNAASDGLVWVGAVAPFALGAGVLAIRARRIEFATTASLALAVAVVSAVATTELMHSLGFKVIGLTITITPFHRIPANVLQLGRMVALLGGANYALPGGYPREPLRLLLALLACAGVGAVVVAAIKHAVRQSEPKTCAYALFWATSTLLLVVGFVGTTNATALGAGSFLYLLALAPAAGAGIGLLAARSRRAQLIVGLAVAIVGATNIAGIVQGRAGTPPGAIGTYARPLAHLLEQKGVTRGYAGYWDAEDLSWQTGMHLLVAPVTRCDLPRGPGLCAFHFFTIRSWYDEHPGPSFLIVDPTTGFLTTPPPLVRDATASYRFGQVSVYIFPYDLARHIRPPT